MKIAFAFLISVILAAAAFAGGEPVGRFQLLYGIVEMVGKNATVEQHTVFRIDTATGKTWEFMLGHDKDGKMIEFWNEVPEVLPLPKH